ncbi:MAG: ABC transporter permease [Pirellulales bacterium]|nr:ABC transporter permease [Pirellulales bacterium]
MTGYPRLFRQFILRSLVRQKTRTAVAVLGITLGVAVMIAIRMANQSVTHSFRTAVESLAGDASLQVTGAAGPFDELLLGELGWLREYGSVSPVIESYIMLVDDRREARAGTEAMPRGELLHLLGVDVLEDLPIREYRLLRTSREDRQPTALEFLNLLADPEAIVLTERFARKHHLEIGDRVRMAFGSTRKQLSIRGLLLDEGPAKALDGNFALMDIAAAQWACDRLGQLDRLDVKLKPGIDPDDAARRIAARLRAGLAVRSPNERYGRTETMIAAFHFNLTALSAIALVVGLFLIYNTIAISVGARREEIGMLQAVGSGRRMVVALFLGEALLIGAVGTVFGLFLGRWFAGWTVMATAETVETFYIAEAAETSARSLSLAWPEIGMAVGLALPLALLAAALPAREAAAAGPVEVIRGSGQLLRGFRPPRKHLLVAAVLTAAGWGLTRLEPWDGRPVFGFLAELLFMLGGAFTVPAVLWLMCGVVKRLLPRWLPPLRVESQLAGSNLLGAIPRVSISVAALGVSLAMMVAISVMVGSFRDTVVYWLDTTLRADLWVKPTMLDSAIAEARMAPEAVEVIRSDPDVAATGWFTARQIPYADRYIRLAATDIGQTLQYGRLLFKSPADAPAAVRRWIGADAVLVSESFSLYFKNEPGDTILLPTVGGLRPFTVAAVYYDYASNQGTVLMDVSTYARHFAGDPSPSPSSMAIYLRPGADAEAVRSRLIRAVGDGQELYFVTNDDVRREALRIFDSTFTITYALELIAILVAGLGVVSTLITLIHDRKREVALLALLGATARQLRRMIVIEAVLIGAVSQLVGIAVGIVLAVVLIYVINVQSFGWTIQFHLPLAFLLQSTLLILAATAVCGLYPAVRAARVDALQTVREE